LPFFFLLPVWTGSNDEFRASYGYALAVVGDLDADGFDEFVVGAFRADDEVPVDEGEVYLYRGGPSAELDPPVWTGRGGARDAFYGRAVACAGDLDGDGIPDLAVGAPQAATGASEPGRVYVHSGGRPPVTAVEPAPGGPGLEIESPCRRGSRLAFRLPRESWVHLAIYDLRGRRVRVLLEETRGLGEHGLVFDGRDDRGRRLPAGSYFLRLRTDRRTTSTRFVLLP
jgi:hypothetical protein